MVQRVVLELEIGQDVESNAGGDGDIERFLVTVHGYFNEQVNYIMERIIDTVDFFPQDKYNII